MGSKLTDFLRRLVAPEQKEATDQGRERAVTYKGYAIRPTPRRQGSQWLTAGAITKELADGVKEHRFIRAETHGTKDAADAFSILKAKQIIDEQGDRLLEDG